MSTLALLLLSPLGFLASAAWDAGTRDPDEGGTPWWGYLAGFLAVLGLVAYLGKLGVLGAFNATLGKLIDRVFTYVGSLIDLVARFIPRLG